MLICPLDTETTGLLDKATGKPGDHRIIEACVRLVDLRTREQKLAWTQRIDPQRSISAQAQAVHKITSADLAGEPTWDVVGPRLHKVMSKASLLIAHNGLGFDLPFLNGEFERIGLPAIKVPMLDTMLEGRWATPTGAVPSLQALCFACGVTYDPDAAHAADYDVDVMTAAFFRGLDWGYFRLPETLAMELAA